MRGTTGPRALALLVLIFLIMNLGVPRRGLASALELEAKAAVLMDAASGRVLYSKNSSLPLPQASTTKITTALVALENGRLNGRTRVSKKAAETPEASIWLEEGEELTLEELLYALLLQSANDAAVAVAEEISGTEENFVALMNDRARELGARNTHYVNPHGLDDPDHYTTAYDLALITRQAMTLPEFRRIVATTRQTIPWATHPWGRVLYNHNRLVVGSDAYPGATGVKTGYTQKAGSCLVGSAGRGDLELIAVVLNSPNMYQEVKKMLDFGFENYTLNVLAEKDKGLTALPVARGRASYLTIVPERKVAVAVRPGEAQRLVTTLVLPDRLEAPVRKGEVVGRLYVRLGQSQVAEFGLLAGQSVARRSFWSYFVQALLSVFSLG